jgi:hypothetical protein
MKRGSRSRTLSSKIWTRVRRERKFPGTISKDLIEEAVFGPLELEIREED